MTTYTSKNEREETVTNTLDQYLGKRINLSCQVGVCIFAAPMTLEPGHGLCAYDCVSGEIRIGIGAHCVSQVKENMDGTLSIFIS